MNIMNLGKFLIKESSPKFLKQIIEKPGFNVSLRKLIKINLIKRKNLELKF